jgi:DNA-binding NarL/FixJ family response regulator
MRPMTRSILIVDDHPGFRRAARDLLDAEGFAVVGEAPDGETAVSEARRLHPSIVLLDIQLPDLDGFEVAEQLAGMDGPPLVVLVSSRSRQSYADQLVGAPVAGFIPKGDLTGTALRALVG